MRVVRPVRVEAPVTERVEPREAAPVKVEAPVTASVPPIVALLVTARAVPADEKVLVPVKIWLDLLSRATFDESAESRMVFAAWPMQPRVVA